VLSSIDTSGAGFYAAKRLDDSMGVAERIPKLRGLAGNKRQVAPLLLGLFVREG
jgi:hypothetical protein